MSKDEIIRSLDNFKDTFVEQYGAYKLKGGVPGNLLKSARKADLVRNYFGLDYYNPDGDWIRPKWSPSLSERWFFFRHRVLAKLKGKSHVYSEADQKRLWTIRGGENYSFESEAEESREYAREFFTTLLEIVPVARDALVLELGCGSGRNLALLKEMGFTHLKGVDFSETQVEFCKKNGFDVQLMDISELEFPDNSFDLVFTNSVLLHVPPDNIERVMKEAVRVSKSIVAFREHSYGEEVFKGHVYKYNYLTRLSGLGFTPEKVGEFIVVRK